MSVALLNRVRRMPFPPEHRGAKFVLAMLAFRYWADEGHAFPTVAELAEETAASDRQVYRDLAWLVEADLLTIEQRRRANGTQTSSSYTFPWLDAAAAAPPDAHVSPSAQPADAHVSPSTPNTAAPPDAHVTRPADAHVSPSQGSRLTPTSPLSKYSSRELPTRQPPSTTSSSPFAPLTDGALRDDLAPLTEYPVVRYAKRVWRNREDDGADEAHAAVSAAAPDGAPVPISPAAAAVNGKIVDLAERMALNGTPADQATLKQRALAKAAAYTAAYEARKATQAEPGGGDRRPEE